ncbi:diaminobutyrate--2-oxoglutarate transaminase, partial [Methanocorpusculum sp.]|nr:diaminobutyrate--2-oxoglutarate transaminase [Methanocorpusculum sp.]
EAECKRKEGIIREFLETRVPKIADNLEVRGMGVMWGIDFGEYSPLMAYDIRRRCFEKGVILELCGREDTVVKIMAAITIPDDILLKGLGIVCDVMAEAVANPIE